MVENKNYKVGNLGYKIALITDLHFDKIYNFSLLEKIILNLNENKPSYICLSGDIVDRTDIIYDNSINKLKDFIKKISKIAPTIITLGNHDISNGVNKGNFEDINNFFLSLNTIENVYYLNNKSLVRNDICFTGYNPSFEYYYKKRENSVLFLEDIDKKIKLNKKYYNILLCHSPINVFKNSVLNYSKEIKKANLILSGHMHNGLVLKKFDKKGNMGFISPYKTLFPKFARGIVTKQIDNHEITLIISGGIIKLSNTNNKFIRKFNCLFSSDIVYVEI